MANAVGLDSNRRKFRQENDCFLFYSQDETNNPQFPGAPLEGWKTAFASHISPFGTQAITNPVEFLPPSHHWGPLSAAKKQDLMENSKCLLGGKAKNKQKQ
jgi:hypothetical protein